MRLLTFAYITYKLAGTFQLNLNRHIHDPFFFVPSVAVFQTFTKQVILEVTTAVTMRITALWHVTSYWLFRERYCLHLQDTTANPSRSKRACLLTAWFCSCSLEKEAVCSSDTLVNFYVITRRHIPKDSILFVDLEVFQRLYITLGTTGILDFAPRPVF